MESRLPEKLSDCLELALADIEKVEESDKFVVDMDDWICTYPTTPGGKSVCHVCAAGAVMTQTLGITREHYSHPAQVFNSGEISYADSRRLLALDHLRLGYLHSALRETEQDVPDRIPRIFDVDTYESDPEEWKLDMRRVVSLLREHGL